MIDYRRLAIANLQESPPLVKFLCRHEWDTTSPTSEDLSKYVLGLPDISFEDALKLSQNPPEILVNPDGLMNDFCSGNLTGVKTRDLFTKYFQVAALSEVEQVIRSIAKQIFEEVMCVRSDFQLLSDITEEGELLEDTFQRFLREYSMDQASYGVGVEWKEDLEEFMAHLYVTEPEALSKLGKEIFNKTCIFSLQDLIKYVNDKANTLE